MKYKPITDITDQEIEQLWKDIFQINKITFVKRKVDREEVIVGFETTWGMGTEEDPCFDVEDEVTMWSDTFYPPDFQIEEEKVFYQYKQFMIAKGYSEYWKDNPYV